MSDESKVEGGMEPDEAVRGRPFADVDADAEDTEGQGIKFRPSATADADAEDTEGQAVRGRP